MKASVYKTSLYFFLLVFLPFMVSCSVIGGSGKYANDPQVAAQQRVVDDLEREYQEAKRYAEEAEQREKAAKNRLQAAEHELKALEEQAKRRSEY